MKKKKLKNTEKEKVEDFVWKEITYTCPVRGRVTDKVKVKIIKPQPVPDSSYELDLPFLNDNGSDDDVDR